MIKNNWKLKVTLSKIVELDSQPVQERSPAVKEILNDLRKEVSEYKIFQSGSVKTIEIDNIEELPLVLIRARIASGLTQTGLAKLAGIHESKVRGPRVRERKIVQSY